MGVLGVRRDLEGEKERRRWPLTISRDINLNEIIIPYDGLSSVPPSRATVIDPALRTNADVEVRFRDLEGHLASFISDNEAIVGCVAWLTNGRLLKSLATRESVSIVVQKEDFLRPDAGQRAGWKQRLHERYNALRCTWHRCAFDDTVLSRMSIASCPGMDPVRCVGNHNRDRAPSSPRMHHKFLVGGKILRNHGDSDGFAPLQVWTGSFNLTQNATRSFENAVIIRSAHVARGFYHEWAQIYALSEPLDWTSEWVEPEWRIGT